MLLDVLQERGVPVFGVGKIHDIYNGRGLVPADYVHHQEATPMALRNVCRVREAKPELHLLQPRRFRHALRAPQRRRRLLQGFGRISNRLLAGFLGPNQPHRSADDYRGTTACDPDPRWPTTDHSREYVPDFWAYSPALEAGSDLGHTAETLAGHGADESQRISAPRFLHGKSFSPRCHGRPPPQAKGLVDEERRRTFSKLFPAVLIRLHKSWQTLLPAKSPLFYRAVNPSVRPRSLSPAHTKDRKTALHNHFLFENGLQTTGDDFPPKRTSDEMLFRFRSKYSKSIFSRQL